MESSSKKPAVASATSFGLPSIADDDVRDHQWYPGEKIPLPAIIQQDPPSRNSSWGSYDTSNASSIQTVIEVPAPPGSSVEDDTGQTGVSPYEKDEIPWHPGTVKRTKQKIEERSASSIKRICSDKFGQKHPKEDDENNDGRGKREGSQQRSNSEEVLLSNRSTATMVSTTYTRLAASAPDSYCLCPFGGCSKRSNNLPGD